MCKPEILWLVTPNTKILFLKCKQNKTRVRIFFKKRLKMSTSLENRSSLRKLEFPHCTIEALKRLLATCKTVSHKLPSLFEFGLSGNRPNPAAFLVLSPKETELVLDVIDEFVFFTKPSKTKKITTQLQELQLLQIIVEFYQEKLSDVPDSLELNESTGK